MRVSDNTIDVERFCRSTDISVDEAYRLLADNRTRTALCVLYETDRRIALDALANAIVARSSDSEYGQRGDRRDSVRLWLVHVALPKLESRGLITTDRDDRGRVIVERSCDRLDGHELEDLATSTSQSSS